MENSKPYKCFCGMSYRFESGLCRHQPTCKILIQDGFDVIINSYINDLYDILGTANGNDLINEACIIPYEGIRKIFDKVATQSDYQYIKLKTPRHIHYNSFKLLCQEIIKNTLKAPFNKYIYIPKLTYCKSHDTDSDIVFIQIRNEVIEDQNNLWIKDIMEHVQYLVKDMLEYFKYKPYFEILEEFPTLPKRNIHPFEYILSFQSSDDPHDIISKKHKHTMKQIEKFILDTLKENSPYVRTEWIKAGII